MKKKLPISIDDFKTIIKNNYVYVDKTRYIYDLVMNYRQVFFNRPRRFGKSLLLSTIRYFFEGRKDLFKGLDLYKLAKEDGYTWTPYPVFRFSFNDCDYSKVDFKEYLNQCLGSFENDYGYSDANNSIQSMRFKNLLKKAYEQTGNECVVLINEYDKPFLDVSDNAEEVENNKVIFKSMFGVLKSCSEYIRFVLVLGITGHSVSNLFSGLNHLFDITFSSEYSIICGITEDELRNYFSLKIETMADKNSISYDECLSKLKYWYDGYRFAYNTDYVYNPVSLFHAFSFNSFENYWFRTGTASLLMKRIREYKGDIINILNGDIKINKNTLSSYDDFNKSLVQIMYQTGYLTIKDYILDDNCYLLGIPDNEVKESLLDNILKSYCASFSVSNNTFINDMILCIQQGDLNALKDGLISLFASIVYTSNDKTFEHYFQAVMQVFFLLLGISVVCEYHTFTGRIDCKVETDRFIYLFELKLDKSADEDLKQIKDKSYDLPFIVDNRKVIKIGVAFDSKTRMLSDWKVIE